MSLMSEMNENWRCDNCGNRNDDDFTYCEYCGAKRTSLAYKVAKGLKKAAVSTATLVNDKLSTLNDQRNLVCCPRCGQRIDNKNQCFCHKCGAILEPDSDEPPMQRIVPALTPEEETIQCRHCGNRLPVDSIFCNCCGNRLAETREESREEKLNRVSLSKICPECGASNAQDTAFCQECGLRLR